jgi:hypothetical protein
METRKELTVIDVRRFAEPAGHGNAAAFCNNISLGSHGVLLLASAVRAAGVVTNRTEALPLTNKL